MWCAGRLMYVAWYGWRVSTSQGVLIGIVATKTWAMTLVEYPNRVRAKFVEAAQEGKEELVRSLLRQHARCALVAAA